MKRIYHKVKIPFEIIVRANEFLVAHPALEIEDYLRAQIVLFSTRQINCLDTDLSKEEYFGNEMILSFNLSMEQSLKSIVEEQCIDIGHYIRGACIQIDKELIGGNEDTALSLNLILKAM